MLVLLLACGDDDDRRATTTTTTGTTTSTTTTTTAAVEREDVAVVAVDAEILEVRVLRVGSDPPESLALDPAAEATVQGPDGPTQLGLEQLATFVEQRQAELGGTQEGVPFSIEVTGTGSNRRVTALREIPPG
jgi:hypothetical protein